MSTQNVCYVKINSSAYAAAAKRAIAASPQRTVCSSTSVTTSCMLVTLLLLAALLALAPTVFGNYILTAHARWAYGYLVAQGQPFFYGLDLEVT